MSAIGALIFGLQKALIQCASVATLSMTQVILPVAIISTVVVVRHVSPPEAVTACRYRSNSLPSGGTLSFLQSFGCNLDNECLAPNYTETPEELQARNRFRQLDNSLQPILTNGTKMAKIKKLPAATKAIVKLGNAAAANNLTDLFDSLDLTIGSLFYNESLVVRYLSEEARLLSRPAAEALMRGRLNLTALIGAFGGVSIPDIVCDPAKLNMYLSINYEGDKNATVAREISTALCKLDSDKASNISDFLFSQFNIGKALALFKQVSQFTYNYNLTLALTDVETLLRLIPQFEILSGLNRGLVSQWAVSLVQQLQKLITSPWLLSDLNFISQAAEKVMALVAAMVDNDPTMKTHLEMAMNFLGSGQRLLGALLHLQTMMLDSTLDKIMPPQVLSYLQSLGVSTAALNKSPITLTGLFYLFQVDATASSQVAAMLCDGSSDLKTLFTAPASYPHLLDQVQGFLCSNSTALGAMLRSANLTNFLQQYYTTGAALNATQMVMDVAMLTELARSNNTIIAQLIAIVTDPTWRMNINANNITEVATMGAVKALEGVLSKLLPTEPLRSQVLLAANLLLLEVEAMTMQTTLEQEFTTFLLNNSAVSNWVAKSAAALPGALVQQSLLTVPVHALLFAYTHGLSDRAEVQRILCHQRSLQDVVDPSTRALLQAGGTTANATLQLFCTNVDVFVTVCDFFKAKQDHMLARAAQLATRSSNFTVLSSIAETFSKWLQLQQQQKVELLRQNDTFATWTEQAIEQLASRANATCDWSCVMTLLDTCMPGIVMHGSLIPTVAGYHFADKANPHLAWWPASKNSMVANINLQMAAYYLANGFAIPSRREALLKFAESPQAAASLGLAFQLFLEMQKSPPAVWELGSPSQPLCNGSWLLDSLPVLKNYPAGVKLNGTFCDLFAAPANPHGSEHLKIFSTVVASVRSLLGGYNYSAGGLADSLLGYINQNQLLTYFTSAGGGFSASELGLNGTGLMKLPVHIGSMAYELLYSAATSNATDPVVAQILLQINFQLNMQQRVYQFVWQFLDQLNATRDIHRAILDTPELTELLSSLPAATKDLLRAAVEGHLTVTIPSQPLAGTNRTWVVCVDYLPASIFGAVAGNLSSVRRFSNALCAAVQKVPGAAMTRFGPLLELFDPTKQAALSASRVNVSTLWTYNQQISDLMMGLVRLQVTDFLPSAINITDWVEFGNKFSAETAAMFASNLTTLLQRYSQVALQQLLADPNIGPTVQIYVSSATQLINQFASLLKASNYSATGLVSGTELGNFVALFNQVPALLPTVLRTAFEMQKDPSMAMLWQPVFANPGLLCSNFTTFTQLLRTPESVDPASLQADICRVLSFNSTALLGQLFQRLPALSNIIDQLTCLSTTGCRPGGTGGNGTSEQFFAAIQAASAEFQSMVGKFSPGNIRMEIFNSSYLALLLAPELQRFQQIENDTLDAQLQRYLSTYAHLIQGLMSGANMTSINLDVLVKMLDWHQALLDLMLGGPARLEAMLNGTADGQRLWRMVSSLPALAQVLVHTSTQHPTRLVQLQMALSDLMHPATNATVAPPSFVWISMCRLNFSQFFVVPPGVAIDLNAFRDDVCSLNLTTTASLPAPIRTLFEMTGSRHLTPEALIQAINLTSVAATRNWSAVAQIWMPFASQWVAAFSGIAPATPSMELPYYQLDATLAYLPLDVYRQVENVMSLANYLLDLTIASVNHLLVSNSTSPVDALIQLPETQKLVRLASENLTDVLVAAAYNQRPIQFLLTLNQTEAFKYLCLSQNATLMAALGMSDFKLTSPPGVCVGCIVDRLCQLNVTALSEENAALGTSLASSWTSGDRKNLTFVQLGKKVTQLQAFVMQLVSRSNLQSPGLFQGANWEAAIKLLGTKYGNTSTIPDNAQELLLTFYLSMKNSSAQAAFASALSGILGQWAPRLEALLASKSLYELFKGLPVLDALYNITARDGGVSVLRVVLDAAIGNPSKLVELILNPGKAAEAFGQLCNGTMDLATMLAINSSSDTRSVQRALCAVLSDTANVGQLSSRLIYHMGLSSMFPGPTMGNDTGSGANLTEIQSRFQSLFVTLQSLLTLPPTDLLPKLNLSVYSELLTKLSRPVTPEMLLGYYSTLHSLLKTYLPAAEFLRVQDIISDSVNLLNALIEYTGATLVPGQVDLSHLVANVSSAEAFMQQLLRPHNLTGLQVMTTKLPELYGRLMTNASSICSLDFNSYFVLPESLNASQLQSSLCLMASNFQTQVMANMNIMKLMQAINGLATPNQTLSFDRVWQLYSSLMAKSALLASVGNVTYRGVPLSQLFRLDGLPNLQTLFPDVTTTSGQMNLLFGVADTVAGMLDTMAAKDPLMASVLKVTQATLAWVHSFLSSWNDHGRLSLGVIFGNASNWMNLLSNTTVSVSDLSALVNMTLRVDKLTALLSKPAAIPTAICNSSSGFSAYFEVGATVPALDKVFNIIFCDAGMQQKLQTEFLRLLGIDTIMAAASGGASNGTSSVSWRDISAQIQQVVNQAVLVVQRPFEFDTNGTIIDSLMKLLGSNDALAQLAALLQAQFAQASANLNFLPPLLEAAYGVFKATMPAETVQLDLAIAVSYEIMARVNAEVTNLLGQPLTLETLVMADNVLSPLLKSLSATDAATLKALVQAVLNTTEFNRWIATGFTTALCKEDLNKLFVSALPMNLTALQDSVCTMSNSSALMNALGAMFNSKNSLLEMLTSKTVKQSVSATNLYAIVRELSAKFPALATLNATALDAQILSMIGALQAGSSGIVTNYKAYLSNSLAVTPPLQMSPGDLALVTAIAGKLEQSVSLLSAVHRLITGRATPEAFVQALSVAADSQRVAAALFYARGSQSKVATMCTSLSSVFTQAADIAHVNASICQQPSTEWLNAKLSGTAADQMFAYLIGVNATFATMPWQMLEPTLLSAIAAGELLATNGSSGIGSVNATVLLATLQQVVAQPALGPLLDSLLKQHMTSADAASMQRVLQISTAFLSVMLTARFDNLTNSLKQPAVTHKLMALAAGVYFQMEVTVMLASPEYATLAGGNLTAVLCNAAEFESQLPGVRLMVAHQKMASVNDTRVNYEVHHIQSTLCRGAQQNQLMLQQLESLFQLSQLVNVATSFQGWSSAQLVQELLSGNFSISRVAQVLSNPSSAMMQFFNQLFGNIIGAVHNSTASPTAMLTSGLHSVCLQLFRFDQVLWRTNGTSVTVDKVVAAVTNNADLIESMLCDLAAADLANVTTKVVQLLQHILSADPSTANCLTFAENVSPMVLSPTIGTCWSNPGLVLQKLAMKLQDYSSIVQLANHMTQLQAVLGPEVTSYIVRVLNTMSSSIKTQLTIQHLLANSTMSLDQLSKLLDVTKELFNTVISSSITVNSSLIATMSDDQLYGTLCSPKAISQVISFPPVLAVNMAAVSTVLCRQMNASALDRQRILLTIRGAAAPSLAGLDLSAWIKALTNFNNLMAELNQLTDVRDLLRGFDIRRMSEYESAILALIRSFPGEKLQKIGYALVNDLRALSSDPVWSSLMNDLNLFFKSLRLFEFAKPLFPVKLQVKDFVDDPQAVTDYLVRQGLPLEVANLVLESYLSSEQLFNFSLKLQLPQALCSVKQLTELIDFSNVTYNISSLVDELCVNGTLGDIENITETILRMGNFGRFFTKNLAEQLVNSLLNSSGVTVNDLKDAIQIIQETGADLQNAFNILSELSNVVSTGDPGGLDTSQGLNGVSEAVCGVSGKFNFTSVYGIGLSSSSSDSNSNGRRRRRRSTSSGAYAYHLGQLANNEFCRRLYDLTQTSTAGRVGWTYVKPIIRGRVIVTPDTNATRLLMSGVEEEFTKLMNLQGLSSSLSSLLPTGSDSSSAASLSNLLSNSLASSAFTSVFGASVNLTQMQSLLNTFSGNQTANQSSSTQMLQLIQNLTACIETNRTDYYATGSSQYESHLQAVLSQNLLLAVVTFDNLPARSRRATAGSSGLPAHVKYTIRMPYGTLYKTSGLTNYPEMYEKRDNFMFDLAYQRGFVQLQEAIDRVVVRLQTGQEMPAPQTQQMPSPCLEQDTMLRSFGLAILPLCGVFMWLAPLALAIQQVMYDREHRLEVPLFLMGLRPSVHFLQWFGVQMLNMLILSAIVTISTSYGGLMPDTDPGILFVLFALYSFSVLGFGYMVSAFFITSSVACVISLLLYLLTFVPFIFAAYMHNINVHALRAINIFSPTAFSLASRSIVALELSNYRVTWADLEKSVFEVRVYWNILALGLDGIGYFLIGWYFRNVLPGKHGVPQSPLFFLRARYWGYDSARGSRPEVGSGSTVVEVKDVSKKFGSKQAVQNLNLTLREGETTVLLGPNGAGKSTTINMMTGLISCDSGNICINGLNIRTSFYRLRSSMGFCPQYNVYYEDMSVKRNLSYFGGLKGCSKAELQSMLHALRLYKVRNINVRHLSGGQKRRLSIGLAFLGKPSLVILDEPTAAVDPEARRTIWELIKEHRCTTLICTHDMQEAEVLGDHVAVMVEGQIVENRHYSELSEACRYTVSISSESPQALAEDLKSQDLVSSEPAINERQSKVLLTCKKNGLNLASLTKRLSDLKAARQLVSWFSITCSTVADFFNSLIFGKEIVQDSPQSVQYEMRSGKPSTCGSVVALMIKRFHHTRRSWMTYIGMMVLPCLFIVLAMGSTMLRPTFDQESPKMLLTPTNYGPKAVSFLYQETGFGMTDAVRETLRQPPGLGTVCMTGNDRRLLHYTAECASSASSWVTQNFTSAELEKYRTYNNCTCGTNSRYSCSDEYSRGRPPSILTTSSGDIVHEQHTNNLEDLLLRSTTRFNLTGHRIAHLAPAEHQRWGGLQLQANASIIWFDNRGYHTLPAYLNAYANTMLRAYVYSSNSSNYTSDYGISTYNHPLPMQRSQLNTDSFDTAIRDAGLAMCIVFALCFVPASIGLTVSYERSTGQTQHIRLYGMGVVAYWLTSFFWDMLMYLVPMGLVLAIMAAFQIDLYSANLNLAAIAMLLGLFGASAIPLTYIISRWTRSPAGGFLLAFFLLFFVGIVLFCLLLLLQFYVNFANKTVTLRVLTYVFMSLPSFSLGNGVYKVVENQWKATILSSYGADQYIDPFRMDMVAPHAIAMGVACVVFLIINMLCDGRYSCRGDKVRYSYLTDGGSDVGVQEEFDRVNSGACSGDPIQLMGLGMNFRAVRGFRVTALDNLTLSVPNGSCLGLLGPNGSGKSTTFNIVTGQLTGYLGSYSMEGLGYCPQSDPLDKQLTVGETLAFYSRLLGLSRKEATKQAEQLIAALRLPPNKVAKALSGGQRRKLSVAVAFLGAPRCILLDEPSAGLDAVSRAVLKQLVRCATGQGSSVLFTSHCMDEVEGVCDRVAILIGGKLRAIGSMDSLKEQLGRSYTLTVRCSRELNDRLTKYLQNTFPNAECKMCAAGVSEYAVPITTKLHEIFQAMETALGQQLCSDYTVKQTTLEQVFLELCSHQTDNWREEGSTPVDSSPPSSSAGGAGGSSNIYVKHSLLVDASLNGDKAGTVRSSNGTESDKADVYKVYL